ncbi:MAG: RluA family pseudouridine synthase [Verrucomicrobia bacterium]|nr:RluA family pseudouridine synthase [Verrucomicrobiota bacterium]
MKIELPGGARAPILHEDRAALAIDKPPGWILAPPRWTRTSRNLQLALMAGIAERAPWARLRNLKFIRFVHRLDAETSGVLLLAKSREAVRRFTRLFAARRVRKRYLAVVRGRPPEGLWACALPLRQDPRAGRVEPDRRRGKPAETRFRALETIETEEGPLTLIEAEPLTGRTHQIRVHLAASGCPIAGDPLYGREKAAGRSCRATPFLGFGLRAAELAYQDPFTGQPRRILAPEAAFRAAFGFSPPEP